MLVSLLLGPIALLQKPMLPPVVGAKAPAFAVRGLDGREVRLAPSLRQGPVVLVMLRGYPGYQCPFCTRQVGELIQEGDALSRRRATVVLVYPGEAEGVNKYAGEFIAGKNVPANFRFTVDPGYRFTESYGLRWNAPGETAYPATFVIGRNGRVVYAKVSREHGDRAPMGEVIAALDKLEPSKR